MVLRLLESVVGRALAVVPVAVTGIFKPSGQTNINDAAAIGMFTVDGATGLPNSVTSPTFISEAGGNARDYFADVTWGIVAGQRSTAALGNNPDIDIAPEDIWTGGGLYPWMTASTALEIVSDSATDAAAGTGARTVAIVGLNAAFVEATQVVTLNGLTAVPIPTSLYRINAATALTAGSNGTNAGNISIRDAGGGTVRAILPATYGVTRQSQFTVPAGYTLQIVTVLLSINRPSSARDASIASYVKPDGGAYRLAIELSIDGNPHNQPIPVSGSIAEKTDFGLRATSVSTTNTDITAGWLGILRLNATP